MALLLVVTWGSADMDVGRLPGTRPHLRRDLRHTLTASAATRYRSLQQLFGWLDEEGEIDGTPMAKMRPPKIPEKPVPVLAAEPVLPDEDVRRPLA